VDATYCKARVNRRVVAQAVVVATGVCGDGRREVLGFAVGDSEDGAFWTAFLRTLKARGLGGVQLVIADAHLGLRQAVNAVMAGASVQRCRVHFLRNMLAQVPKGSAEMVAAASATPPRSCWPSRASRPATGRRSGRPTHWSGSTRRSNAAPTLSGSSPTRGAVAAGRAVLVEAHDEWQVSDRRYLSEGSMALLTKPTREVAPAQLMPA
jgi:hypothetical protein